MGLVYLIHFAEKYHHAQHYIGYAGNLENRIAAHQANQGARLLQVINNAGIAWNVVRIWEGDRTFERKLKNWHGARPLCPVCQKGKR